jgi:integrase
MRQTATVRVAAYWKGDKGRYYLRCRDATGKKWTEQTDITTRNERSRTKAVRLAEARESELKSAANQDSILWDDFVIRYQDEHLKFTSRANQHKWDAVCKFVDLAAAESCDVTGPLQLSDIRTSFLSQVEALLRSELAAGSVGSYMGTLRGGLSWAAYMEMMSPLPRKRRPPGRVAEELLAYRLTPISEQSLAKMMDVTPDLVGKQHAESVNRYLQALWLSGCRMREPLSIHSFRKDCHHPVTLEGSKPKMYWTSEQKSKRGGTHRITIDFAVHIKQRLDDSTGFLYRPRCETGEMLDRYSLGRLVADIGAKAEVYAEEGKTVTAKHFRTSFVQRWSLRGMPEALIQDICRHRSIETTRKYYVGNAKPDIEFDESVFGTHVGTR